MDTKQGYEEDLNKPQDKDINLIRIAYLSIAFIAVLVVVMMCLFVDTAALVFGRYLIDAITWTIMAIFFHMLYIRFKTKFFNMDLKLISLLACIATSTKFLASIYYTIDRFGSNVWIDIYYVAKLIVWLILALFFFNYWRKMCSYDFKNNEPDEEE